jgi:hypothetical protein
LRRNDFLKNRLKNAQKILTFVSHCCTQSSVSLRGAKRRGNPSPAAESGAVLRTAGMDKSIPYIDRKKTRQQNALSFLFSKFCKVGKKTGRFFGKDVL